MAAGRQAAATAQQPATTATAPDTRADSADRAWLALVDAGQYGESWKAAAASFQTGVPQAKWEKALKNVRSPLGRMTSRTLKEATFHTSLPGVPDGAYIVATYRTSFANKAEAQETVTATQEKDGNWRVSGYFIR